MVSVLIFAVALLAGSSHSSMAGTGAGPRFQDEARPEQPAQEHSQTPASAQVPAKESDAPPTGKPATDAPSVDKTEPVNEPPKTPAASGSHKRRKGAKKPSPAPASDGEPRKIVIHRGGTTEPVVQILPGMSPEEVLRQRESAEQLLAAADSSVKQLASRALDSNQQETVVQIRQYIEGARAALNAPDTPRAHTLALKAYLLADDLVKH